MLELNTGILAIGSSVLVLGLFSRFLKRYGISEPVILLLLGIVLGPTGLGLLQPEKWGNPMQILEQVARVTLAVGLMGVALRIPRSYTQTHWKSVLLLLFTAMPFMWLMSSLAAGSVLNVSWWSALLIGAAITPTDPVVASSVVTGEVAQKYLPESIRRLLSFESGLNDGLAYAFVLLPILMLSEPVEEAAVQWLLDVLLWEILGATVMGILFGYVAGRVLQLAERKKLIEEPSIVAYTTALAVTTLAGVKLMGSDGILAVFISGITFDQVVSAGERRGERRVVEGVDRFFTLPIFGLLGLLIPWRQWIELGWSGALLAMLVLFLRRLPFFLLARPMFRDVRCQADSAFVGWFGPIGVAALYYAALATERTEVEQTWPVVSLIVSASIVVHGLTATPLSILYGRFRKAGTACSNDQK